MTDDFEVSSSTETPEQVQLSLQIGDEPAEQPETPAEPVAEPQADGDEGEHEEDLSKYTATQIHYNPRLRIQKATIEAAKSKREAEEARTRASQYEAEIERLRKSAPSPDGAKEPQEEDFETYKDYVKAQARWEARQEFEERSKASRANWEQEQIQKAQNERVTAYKKQVEAEGDGFLDKISQDVLNIAPDSPLGHSITTSQVATKLMSYFTEHPDELRALSGLHPALVIREIGKIEGKLEGVVVTANAPRVVSVSRAKPPVRPVAGTPSVGDELPEDASFEDYFRHENAKERARTH